MAKKDSDFVHLHLHTDFSLLDGACHIDRLCKHCCDYNMKAVAITDHGNLFGLTEFFQTAKKHGIKPLLGCEVYLVYDHKMTEKPERGQHKYHHMGLIAKNLKGYQNLIRLVSDAHTKGLYYKPRTDMEQLAAHAEGLIGFTGCLQGVVPQHILKGDIPGAKKALSTFIDIFGRENYFVELQDHGISEQQQVNKHLIPLAEEFGLKLVCTNDVHYVGKNDWAPHDSLLCIQTGSKIADEKRLRYTSHQFYLKSRQEMELIFGEIPHALTNTCEVAEMCDLEIPFGNNLYPVYKAPEEIYSVHTTNIEYLKFLCVQGLKERYGVNYHDPDNADDPELAKTLAERIDYELSIIEKAGFIDYFLIVWDFIRWAREQTIPVGPGRGSGAGCLTAYVLKITDIDPIRFKLLFERFLNPERVSPPDFDIDFCMRRRGEVIEYVRQKYGSECVANIITFGTFGAKMIVRDLARVNDIPYAEADRIAKMVPDDIGITLDAALEKSTDLKYEVDHNPVAAKIIQEGRIIEGMVRNTGTHAAGVIISDRPLRELVPVTLQDGILTTQYPKDPVEKIGLLKMDFLGLKTLTIIADAQDNIRRTRNNPQFNIDKVPFEDDKTFQLLNDAKTVGVFQLESGGMQSLCRQFNISNIDEIVALIALYRPGPMDWIPDYVKGKKDPSTIKYPHPLLEEICKETYGVMVYQEQVMEAARVIAGYSLGAADILRRAMGKKKIEEMAEQRAVFIEGAKKHNNIESKKAEELFDILEKFAGYGFNKSHSAAYAILAFQTGYLKANYPVEFMAAALSSELGNADKVRHFIGECSVLNIPVLSPDVNESRDKFTPIIYDESGSGAIRFGLSAIKGVGDSAALKILCERDKSGPFKDFMDFAVRVDSRAVNRRVLECLIRSGAFDSFGKDRQHLFDSIDAIMSEVSAVQKDKACGQTSLFDLMDNSLNESNAPSACVNENGPTMPLREKLQHEKELLGFYLSGHPMNEYAGFDTAINTFREDEIEQLQNNETFRVCGIVDNINKRISKKDNRAWAFFNLTTRNSSIQLNLFPDAYMKFQHHVVEGNIIVVSGTIRRAADNDEVRFNVADIDTLERRLPSLIESVTIVLDVKTDINDFLKAFSDYLHAHDGFTKVRLLLKTSNSEGILTDIAASSTCNFNPKTFREFLKMNSKGVLGFKLDVPPPPKVERRYPMRAKA